MISFLNTITDRVPSYLRDDHHTDHQLAQPLQVGQDAPLFRIFDHVISPDSTGKGNNLFPARRLGVRAKIIAFWSLEWNNYGIQFLKQIEAHQQRLRLMGGEVLVLTDEDAKMVKGISKLHNLSLNFYRDQGNALATRFGLNGETRTTRKLFRLRKRMQPYLGLYVITGDNKIAYSFAWSENRKEPSFRKLLETVLEVYHAGRS